MPADANWRFNPFTELTNYYPIVAEPQTVAYLPEWKIYGFVLNEGPKIEESGNSLSVIEEIPGGLPWSEVDRSVVPSAGSYRLDTLYGTGIVEFDPADDGKSFLVTYTGEGSLMNAKRLSAMVSEGVLAVNGARIGGFFTDGTPFFRKFFVAAFTGAATPTIFVNHGLGNIASERRVVGGRCLYRNPFPTLSETYAHIHNTIRAFVVRDNDFYVTYNSSVPPAATFWVMIEYIL